MRYVCPLNGDRGTCYTCKRTVLHVREEWLNKGQKIPTCEKHKVELVLSN